MLYSRLRLVDQGRVLVGPPSRGIERQRQLVAGQPQNPAHRTHQGRFRQPLRCQRDVGRAPSRMQDKAPAVRIKRDLHALLRDEQDSQRNRP